MAVAVDAELLIPRVTAHSSGRMAVAFLGWMERDGLVAVRASTGRAVSEHGDPKEGVSQVRILASLPGEQAIARVDSRGYARVGEGLELTAAKVGGTDGGGGDGGTGAGDGDDDGCRCSDAAELNSAVL